MNKIGPRLMKVIWEVSKVNRLHSQVVEKILMRHYYLILLWTMNEVGEPHPHITL